MVEYIDRKAAVGILELMGNNAGCSFIEKRIRAAAKRIGKIPAADVTPVVRSRWRHCGFLQECQTCGEIYSIHGGNAGKSWNYCPNCGAKMDGGIENASKEM